MDERIKSLFLRQSFTIKETLHPAELNNIDSYNQDKANSILLKKIKDKLENATSMDL